MAFNKYMHPRNIYRKPPDFKMLGKLYPEFQQFVTCDSLEKGHVDFRNHEALRAVTKTLLKHDFNLEVEIPPDRLIPTLPSRLNYILWIEDLLAAVPANLKLSEGILGLDIGTGSTCIYPLVGAKKNGWKFIATDSDVNAIEYAKKNVEKNGLQELIEIMTADSDSYISHVSDKLDRQLDFCMCNPPFFVNDEEASPLGKGRSESRPPPKTINCPTETEAVTDGGEVALIEKMIQESLHLKDKIKIYTSMMGKKQSLKHIKKILFSKLGKEVSSFVSTEFCQGHTIRWAIAWTCTPEIKLQTVVEFKRPKELNIKPISFEIKRPLSNLIATIESFLERVTELLEELKIDHTQLKVNKGMATLHCNAYENTWSNQRRKRRALVHVKSTPSCRTTNNDQQIDKETTNRNSTENAEDLAASTSNGTCNSLSNTTDTKKRKYDELLKEDSMSSSTNSPLVQFLLSLRKFKKQIILEMQWISGSLGKDGCNQILQFFRNKLG